MMSKQKLWINIKQTHFDISDSSIFFNAESTVVYPYTDMRDCTLLEDLPDFGATVIISSSFWFSELKIELSDVLDLMVVLISASSLSCNPISSSKIWGQC